MTQLSFWFEFGSTYSYLTAMRIEEIAKQKDISIQWQPFLLGPIFKKLGWTTSPFKIYKKKGEYMWRDMERLCEINGLPSFTRPNTFPQHSLLAARIAIIGQTENWVSDYTKRVFISQFSLGADIGDEKNLKRILEEMELKASSIIDRAKNDQGIKDKLKRATEEAEDIGIFGAPSFVTEDGELFWGNDRLEQAFDWALKNE